MRHNEPMLIPKPFWDPIRAGEVTVAFRRWKRLMVKPGRVYRTAAGRLHVDSVEVIDPAQIGENDARLAGLPDPDAVRRELRGDVGDPVYRIRFHHLDEPDPRSVLANDDDLTEEDIESIGKRLARLDAASSSGPWTLETLDLIERHPERRAPDLAEMVGRETQPFKLDVRKLKNLGLTLSFRIGYRLSPRGKAYVAAVRDRG